MTVKEADRAIAREPLLTPAEAAEAAGITVKVLTARAERREVDHLAYPSGRRVVRRYFAADFGATAGRERA